MAERPLPDQEPITMNVTRIRALRGPNLWNRRTAIEAIVECEPDDLAAAAVEAAALESCALSLQQEAGCAVSFSRTAATREPGVFQVIVEYSEEAVGRLALDLAIEACAAERGTGSFDRAAAIARLRELDEDERLGPSTGSIVDAAVARGIPYRRLTQGSLVQFGWGSRQRRIQAAEVDQTSAIAESIAQDKELTKSLRRSSETGA